MTATFTGMKGVTATPADPYAVTSALIQILNKGQEFLLDAGCRVDMISEAMARRCIFLGAVSATTLRGWQERQMSQKNMGHSRTIQKLAKNMVPGFYIGSLHYDIIVSISCVTQRKAHRRPAYDAVDVYGLGSAEKVRTSTPPTEFAFSTLGGVGKVSQVGFSAVQRRHRKQWRNA